MAAAIYLIKCMRLMRHTNLARELLHLGVDSVGPAHGIPDAVVAVNEKRPLVAALVYNPSGYDKLIS